ncbi:MAG: Rieske (2Fe-2S) protein [Pseudomonadota bacterium]
MVDTVTKFLTAENLYQQIKNFTKGMSVTRNCFNYTVPRCTLPDMAWNHMDQLHRQSIHNTYEKSLRIALGKDFALSLTQFSKWPLFITVTDVRVADYTFYQSMTIGGIIFLHFIISFEETENHALQLKNEWFIASHKIFRFAHGLLNRKLIKLNERLQVEDAQIRNGRFDLRNKGYTFRNDPPDYYNSNRLGSNTIYPMLPEAASFLLANFKEQASQVALGNVEFILKKEQDNYLIWPAFCPHEGGPLLKGKMCDTQITCPWHGLRFRAAALSADTPCVQQHGFEYSLVGDEIQVLRLGADSATAKDPQEKLEMV